MYRQGDKEKIAAKLVAESRERRGVCREGETQPAWQGKALQPDIACCNPNSSKTRRNDGITSASGSPVVLTGVAIAWEKLVLSDVFSKSEALRTGFELPVLLMQIEVIAGAAGTRLNPRKEGKGKCSSNCFYRLVAIHSTFWGNVWCLQALWSFIWVLSSVKIGDIPFSFGQSPGQTAKPSTF